LRAAAHMSLRERGRMASAKRILVLGTSHGGGNWPPLAAVIVGLHQAGHAVQCFGDPAIAHDFASAAVAIEVVPAEDPLRTFIAQWRAAGDSGPSPFRAWADTCLPAVRALVRECRPQLMLSELFTMELARLTKAASGLRWCCLNPGCYFGPDSTRPFEADYVGRTRYYTSNSCKGSARPIWSSMGLTRSLTRPHPLCLGITTTWGRCGGNGPARHRHTSTSRGRRGCWSR
jgi:hypothetical protein